MQSKQLLKKLCRLLAGLLILSPSLFIGQPPITALAAPAQPAINCVPPLPGKPAIERGTLSADGHYIEGVVILSGLRAEVTSVVHQALPPAASLLREIDFTHLRSENNGVNLAQLNESAGLGKLVNGLDAQTTYANTVIRLYTTGGLGVWDAVARIYHEARLQNRRVFADPDYALGSTPSTAGSPWGAEGSPWGAEGSPGSGGLPPVEAEGMFWQQWAFGSDDGIGLMDSAYRRTMDETGQRVRVAVFDTSPLSPQGLHTIVRNDIRAPICVWLPEPVVQLPVDATHAALGQHGLFASGLVYAVAPASNIYLIRVLNANAQGDLFTLLNALNAFSAQALTDNATSSARGTLANIVINLSLGFHAEATVPEPVRRELLEVIPALPIPYHLAPGEITPIISLQTQLLNLDSLNAVIVAAAGNDSADQPPQPTQLPARWSRVIGVEAANRSGSLSGRSCYSNLGDIRAPGADGGPSDTDLKQTCVPRLDKCPWLGANCDYGLISFVTQSGEGSTPSGFGYWVGTSFAAPLVSGAAALSLQRGFISSTEVITDLTSHINPANGSIMVGP